MFGLGVRQFANRLKQINDYLPYFPPYVLDKVEVQKLRDSELINIMLYSKPREMSIDITKANVDVRSMNFEEFVNYLERLEIAYKLQKAPRSNDSSESTSKKRKSTEDNDKGTNKNSKGSKNKVVCSICKKTGHDSDKCWFNKDKGNKPPARTSNVKKEPVTERAYTLSELKELFDNLPSHQANNITPHKKRKVTYESSESSDGEVTNHVHVSDIFRRKQREPKQV
jgi:hypothetical protein